MNKIEFELRLDVKEKGQAHGFHFDTIKANDLVGLLTQLMFAIVRVQETLHEKELAEMRGDDDIPF